MVEKALAAHLEDRARADANIEELRAELRWM
jgi:hypothetical protein